MKAPQFKNGDAVTWVDPDEDDVMKPHAGIVRDRDRHDNFWVYFIQETEDFFYLVLEEELTLLRPRD